jgi:hypothetical protein
MAVQLATKTTMAVSFILKANPLGETSTITVAFKKLFFTYF